MELGSDQGDKEKINRNTEGYPEVHRGPLAGTGSILFVESTKFRPKNQKGSQHLSREPRWGEEWQIITF
jgi:hypothetical protein